MGISGIIRLVLPFIVLFDLSISPMCSLAAAAFTCQNETCSLVTSIVLSVRAVFTIKNFERTIWVPTLPYEAYTLCNIPLNSVCSGTIFANSVYFQDSVCY